MRCNSELPLSASFVVLRTIKVPPSVKGCFIDVFKQPWQHLLRAPPRLLHVPLVLHLHALVVIEEPVHVIRIAVLLRFLATASHFANSPAAPTSASETSRLATMHQAQQLSRRLIARSHNACLFGFAALAFGGGQGSPNPLDTSFCHVRSSSSRGIGNEDQEGASSKKSRNDAI